MDWRKIESDYRPIFGGVAVLLTLIVLLGTAIRDPRPHEIPVGLAAPAPMVEQLTAGFSANAPGAFAFTTYSSETEARIAVDQREVVAALVAGPQGARLVVAGAAGDAIAGGVSAAFTSVFDAQGMPLDIEVVHPFGTGDPHGIVLFFLVLAALISSVLVGAISVLQARHRHWTWHATVVITFAVSAGILGALTASWVANDYGAGIWALMGMVGLLSAAIGLVIAALARLFGPAGVGLGVLFVVLLGLVSSGGPLGSAFLPDLYRAIAPWLPVDAAYSAMRSVLYFDGAGLSTPVLVVAAWAIAGTIGLAAADFVWPARARTAESAA